MPATRLYFTASVEEQWRAAVGPWLREQARAAWKNPKPTVILTPSRAESFYLRGRLVDEGISFLGLRFWTPSDARKFLHDELLPETGAPTQAELRLLARACAEKHVRGSKSDRATLASVIREPGAFLRAYDLLLGAGWDPAREGAVYGRELAREFQTRADEASCRHAGRPPSPVMEAGVGSKRGRNRERALWSDSTRRTGRFGIS